MMYVQYADGVINVINLSILHLFCSGIIDQNVCNMMVDLRVSYIYIYCACAPLPPRTLLSSACTLSQRPYQKYRLLFYKEEIE